MSLIKLVLYRYLSIKSFFNWLFIILVLFTSFSILLYVVDNSSYFNTLSKSVSQSTLAYKNIKIINIFNNKNINIKKNKS